MVDKCPHGTSLGLDCPECRAEVDRMKAQHGADAAFPIVHSNGVDSWTQQIGLTKREWLAGLAMQGILVGSERNGDPYLHAKRAVNIADILLKELAK